MSNCPPVDSLTEPAAAELVALFERLSTAPRPALAAWAQAIHDTLLAHLAQLAGGGWRAGNEPELDALSPVELAAAAEMLSSWACGSLDNGVRRWLYDAIGLLEGEMALRCALDAAEHAEARRMLDTIVERDLTGIPPWTSPNPTVP